MQQKNNSQKERSIGKKYASLLQASIRNTINQEKQSFTTLALKTKVASRTKNGQLQRLVLETPKHSFVQHHGFEGIRKNGRKLSLKPKEHLMGFKAIKVLNGLADEIGSVRAEQVMAQINF